MAAMVYVLVLNTLIEFSIQTKLRQIIEHKTKNIHSPISLLSKCLTNEVF